jgi:hypothetical protein
MVLWIRNCLSITGLSAVIGVDQVVTGYVGVEHRFVAVSA